MEELKIHGFGISNFRSFGDDVQYVGPLKKFNIVIGENNSGKSNVARYVKRVVRAYLSPQNDFKPDNRDKPQGNSHYPPNFLWVLVPITSEFIAKFFGNNQQNAMAKPLVLDFLNAIDAPQNPPPGHVWLPIVSNGHANGLELGKVFKAGSFLNNSTSQNGLSTLWKIAHPGHSGGSADQHWIPELLKIATTHAKKSFLVETIPAGRKVETALPNYEEEFGLQSENARKFIRELAALESPNYSAVSDKSKWIKIQNFLRTVMRDESISLEVPHTQDTINFQWDSKYLPIEDLGTGVYQAILLAARATLSENQVICLEEPELHFHPELQRQIMHYLEKETSNQYFITTHSAHIMDAVDACIINVTLEDGQSKISLPLTAHDKRIVCHRLGYRPSDLLQSNCLVWVEGPSDRIYLNYWLKKLAPELEEGWHYSYSVYGGRVLSNFSADDENDENDEVEEFIKILPINRFAVMIMDSDRQNVEDSINVSKTRLKDELEKVGGVVWVTRGKEIENYVSYEARLAAVMSTHKSAKKLAKEKEHETEWDHPLAYINKANGKIETRLSKVKIANEAIKREPDFGILDLNQRMKEIIDFIRHANRMD